MYTLQTDKQKDKNKLDWIGLNKNGGQRLMHSITIIAVYKWRNINLRQFPSNLSNV